MLVGGLEHFLFFHILGIIIPTDEHIFQVETTNHIYIYVYMYDIWYIPYDFSEISKQIIFSAVPHTWLQLQIGIHPGMMQDIKRCSVWAQNTFC